MNKSQEKWKDYLDNVPGLEAAIAQRDSKPTTDESSDFSCFANNLPKEIKENLSGNVESEPLNLAGQLDHHWCLCDMPEGDFPRVHVFSSLPRLLNAISKREGSETAVWVTYGIPLRITKALKSAKGQTRYLLLPNNLAATIGGEDSGRIIDQSLLPDDLVIQEEGWLGDPDYLEDQHYFMETNASIDEDSFSGDSDVDSDYEE